MRSSSLRLSLSRRCALLGAVLWALPQMASADVVYRESFRGAATEPLDGRAPSVRSGGQGGYAAAIWRGPSTDAASAIRADGGLDMPGIKFGGGSAWLPFVPTAGLVYKLTLAGADVRSGDWLGTGFLIGEPETEKRFRDNKAVFWALIRSHGNPLTDQTFSGPLITGPADATSTSASSITIVIDTTAATTWSVRWFLDGLLVRAGQFAPQPITYLGFGFNTAEGAPGTSHLMALTLEADVPGADSDADGLPDAWELAHFRALANEPTSAVLARCGSKDNPDGDVFNNLEESIAGSNPNNPLSNPLDTDADGLADAWEVHHFGSATAVESQPRTDVDGDGFTNMQENAGGSDPTDAKSMPRMATVAPSAQVPTMAEVAMDVARSGRECYLAWTRPQAVIRNLDILRNDKPEPQGRTRIATVEATVCVYLDQTPSATTSYWYWLSYTRPDGQVVEHGPFTTKASAVWVP